MTHEHGEAPDLQRQVRDLWDLVRRLEKAAVEDRKELRNLGRDMRAGFAQVQEGLDGEAEAEKARIAEEQARRTEAEEYIRAVIARADAGEIISPEERGAAMAALTHVIGVVPPNASEEQIRHATDEALKLHTRLGAAFAVVRERERTRPNGRGTDVKT